MPHWSTAEWATVVSAVGAAIAAISAAVSARSTLVSQRRARVPDVSGAVTITPSGELGASFANAGPGLASMVWYIAVTPEGRRCGGAVGDGHLVAGEKCKFPLALPSVDPDDRVRMVWTCRDVDNDVYFWSDDWRQKRISYRKFRRRKDRSLGAVFREMYPDVVVPPRPGSDDARIVGDR